jgi:hypothetical protein
MSSSSSQETNPLIAVSNSIQLVGQNQNATRRRRPSSARLSSEVHLEEDVTPSDEYLLTMMRLRGRLRLKLMLVTCIAVLVVVFSFFVYPRQIIYITRNATLEAFNMREGNCVLNWTSGLPLPQNLSDCVPTVTGHLDLTVRLENSNYVAINVHRYHALIRFANLTMGEFTRNEPLLVEHGFVDVNQSVSLSSRFFDSNYTMFSLGLLSSIRELGKGHFTLQLIGEVDATVLGLEFNTTFNIPLQFENVTSTNNNQQ